MVLVLASNTTINQNDYKIQTSTWTRGHTNVFFLRGSANREVVLEGQTLYLPCEESQENILYKTKVGTAWALKNFDCDFVVRANISCYLDMSKLEDFLTKNLDPNFAETGGFIEFYKDMRAGTSELVPFISGAGIFMTRKAALELENLIPGEFVGVPDDIAITEFLASCGVTIRAMKRGNIHYTRIFVPQTYIRAKSSISPELAGKRMLLIHGYLTSGFKKKILFYFKLLGLELKYAFRERDNPIDYLKRNKSILNSNRLARRSDTRISLRR